MRRLSLFVALLMATLTSTASARDIHLYGAPVRQGDFVVGTGRFVEGRSGAIDMGYADGVTSGHRFRVYRRVGRDYRISGVAIVGLVQRRQSVVTARTGVPIRAGDAVVIAASELTIWTEPRDRLYDERLRRRVALPRRFGYDTRQTAIDEIDLLETRRGNRLKLLEWTRQVTAARPKTTVLWDLTNLKTRRQDFIGKLETFGSSFRYRNKEERANASFTTVVQPISRLTLEPGKPYEAPDATGEPQQQKSLDETYTEPPTRIPRVVPLARGVSLYLGRGNSR